MRVANSEGREFYLQRSKDNRIAAWCLKVEPAVIDLDGTAVEAYANPEISDWIYLRFEGTAYCLWARDPKEFDFLNETSLRITDRGRTYKKRSNTESAEPVKVDDSSSFSSLLKDGNLAREDLDALLVHLPRLRKEIAARANDPNAKEHEYSNDFSYAVRQVVKALFKHRFMYSFDYQPWMGEARRLTEDREALASADLETLRKLLVVHWRQDYWDQDNNQWEWIAANGHLVAVLERLQHIANEMEPADEVTSQGNKFVWEDDDVADIRFPIEPVEDTGPKTPRRKQKWTHELRLKLYSRLLDEFGPYATWGKVAYPANRKREFEEVLKELAAEFSGLTDEAFEWMALWQQMKWGTTTQGTVKNAGFASVYILNKAAALQTGFLKTSDLTGFVHLETDVSETDDS